MLKDDKIETRHERTPLEQVAPLDTPYVLFIDPCGRCNFVCNFCPCNIAKENYEERHKLMSLENFKKIVDGIQIFAQKVKVIYLYGYGEPLLHPEFMEMAAYLKNADVCREIRLVTNGSLLSPDLNTRLVDTGIDLVRISIEALNAQDYKRICGVNLNYERFIENIADLYQKSRGKLKIGCKIVNATLKTEADSDYFHNTFDPISDFAWAEDIVAGWPEFEEMKFPDGQVLEADNWIWKRENYIRCSFPLTMMMVHSNGVVGPCPNDWKIAHNFGNAFETPLSTIWNSEAWKRFALLHLEKNRSEINLCKNCIGCAYDKVDHVADIIADNIRKTL